MYTSYGNLGVPVFFPGNSNNKGLTFKWHLAKGTPIASLSYNYIMSEWKTNSGVSATCPIRVSVSEQWGGLCFAFPPSV